MTETYLQALELSYFEVQFAFEGLADENVWKRPAERLLSIGELAGHHAHGEATRLAGGGDDLSKCRVTSPLVDSRFRYLPHTLPALPSEQHLTMTAEQVYRELIRVHQESVANFKALNPDLDTRIPGCPSGFTYGEFLKYAAFHLAYHTGQMFSVRHLLGEETPDN